MAKSESKPRSILRSALGALGLGALATGSFLASPEAADACYQCYWDGGTGSVCKGSGTDWGYSMCATYYANGSSNCQVYGERCG
jgi:hypothetical protein